MSRYINAEPYKGMCIMKPINVEINAPPCKPYTVTEYMRVKDVDDVPTADVQEVKHGKWIESTHGVFCSECHMDANVDNLYGGYIIMKLKYCPHCRRSGKRLQIWQVGRSHKFYIECPTCHWCGKTRLFLWRAILSWNLQRRKKSGNRQK